MLSTMDSSASNVCIKQNVWRILKCQAEDILRREPALRPLVHEAILKHASFGDALIYRLAQKLGDKILTVDFFLSIFREVIRSGADIERYAMEDLIAVEQRDPACRSIAQAFLYFKGYQSIQAYRLSRFFWLQNRKDIAMVIQGRGTEVFGVDIHPGCTIGPGLLIDHGTGVVIGETAVIGEDCSFLHGITLGGTGTSHDFDRHPKLGNNVFLGCGVTILGNIKIGNHCRVGSSSLVLKGLPAGALAVGSPAVIKTIDPKFANPKDLPFTAPESGAADVITEFSSEIERSKSVQNLLAYLDIQSSILVDSEAKEEGTTATENHVDVASRPSIQTWRGVWYPKLWCNNPPKVLSGIDVMECVHLDGFLF